MRFTPPLHRADGYREALREAGVEPDPELEVLGYFTVDGGERGAAEQLMALPDRPTAIFAESDEMAYGAIRAMRRLGLRVPEDVAVDRLRRPRQRRADGPVDDAPAGRRAGAAMSATRLLAAINPPATTARAPATTSCCRPRLMVRGSDRRERGTVLLIAVLMLVDAANLYFRAFYALPGVDHRAGRPAGQRGPRLPRHDRGADRQAPARPATSPAWTSTGGRRSGSSCAVLQGAPRRQPGGGEDVPDELARRCRCCSRCSPRSGLPRRRRGLRGRRRDRHARRARRSDQVEVVSGDRDMLALATDRVTVLYTGKGIAKMEVMGPAEVPTKYGIPAERYADFAVLRGDPSDGLPGVPGVGEKTAAALVEPVRRGRGHRRRRRGSGSTASRPARGAKVLARARTTCAWRPPPCAAAPTCRSPKWTTRCRAEPADPERLAQLVASGSALEPCGCNAAPAAIRLRGGQPSG